MGRIDVEVVHTSVFGMTPDGGNPCPVVPDAEGLTDTQMRAVASHFGLDTVFVLAPRDERADLMLRYFVPHHEMGMSVHATIAAITVLLDRRPVPTLTRVATAAGTFPVRWARRPDGLEVTVEQFAPQFMEVKPSLREVARALNVAPAMIDETACPVAVVSTSRAKLLVPMRDHMVLDKLAPDFEALWTLCDRCAATGLYAFTLRTKSTNLPVEARQYPLRAGFPEDVATGVAAAALGAHVTHHAVLSQRTPGMHTIRIGQGFAMGKPSLIQADAYVEGDTIVRTAVRGVATITMLEMVAVD